MATIKPDRPAASNPQSLSGLLPFLKPYRWQIGMALVLLVLARLLLKARTRNQLYLPVWPLV